MGYRPFLDVDLETITPSLNQVSAASLSSLGRYISGAGISPALTTADNVLAIISIPAGALGPLADQLENFEIFAQGKFGANANAKRLKIIVNPTAPVIGVAVSGGTTILDTGVVNTNGGGFCLDAALLRASAGTLLGVNYGSIAGAVHQGTTAPVSVSVADNVPFTIVVTGTAATALSDIVLNIFEVDVMS